MRTAIVITSPYGQTSKIARRILSRFERGGQEAAIFHLDMGDKLDVREFGCVVIGCPVYIGKFSPTMIAWVKENSALLNGLRVGFFSVSLNAADKRPEARIADVNLLSGFLQDTGLMADWLASFAGCIHYTKYGFFKRWMMRRISKAAGGPTDTSRDHEMTDWAQVDGFAEAIIQNDHQGEFVASRRLRPTAKPGALQPQ